MPAKIEVDEVGGFSCPDCNKSVYNWQRFCPFCGKTLPLPPAIKGLECLLILDDIVDTEPDLHNHVWLKKGAAIWEFCPFCGEKL